MLSPAILMVFEVTLCFTAAKHMHGWHHDVPEKKKLQPVIHSGLKQLRGLNDPGLNPADTYNINLPPYYNGRAISSTNEIHSTLGRRGFTRQDLLTNNLDTNNYNHKGHSRGSTVIDKGTSALIGGPIGQGSKGEMFRVNEDSHSNVVQGAQKSEERIKDYEAEHNRDHLKTRTTQLTDLGAIDPRSSGIMMDWKNEGIDNVAIKSNQISSKNRAKERKVDVVNSHDYGAENMESANIAST